MNSITKCYQILGLSFPQPEDVVKKAYYKLAHIWHPDHKGGDEETFKEINSAYQLLCKGKHFGVPSVYAQSKSKSGATVKETTSTSNVPEVFCAPDGSSFWTEDQYGFVVHFWGKCPDFEEDIYK